MANIVLLVFLVILCLATSFWTIDLANHYQMPGTFYTIRSFEKSIKHSSIELLKHYRFTDDVNVVLKSLNVKKFYLAEAIAFYQEALAKRSYIGQRKMDKHDVTANIVF